MCIDKGSQVLVPAAFETLGRVCQIAQRDTGQSRRVVSLSRDQVSVALMQVGT